MFQKKSLPLNGPMLANIKNKVRIGQTFMPNFTRKILNITNNHV